MATDPKFIPEKVPIARADGRIPFEWLRFFHGLVGQAAAAVVGTGTSSGTNTGDVTLAGTPNYITIAGQVITRALINLASHVTGRLPYANLTAATVAGVLLGRRSTSAGDWEEITLGSGVSMTDQVLSATGSGGHLHGLMRVLGDGATTVFNLLDVAEYLEHIAVAGAILDPTTFTLSADGSQITFDSAPGAGDVIAVEYVIAGI